MLETVNVEVVGAEWRSPSEGVGEGLRVAWRLTAAPFAALANGGRLENGQRMEVAGPVKLTVVSADAVRTGGMVMALLITGGLSIHMGLLNLVPVPGLDGGQLMFLAIGAVRGRPRPW